MKNYYNEYINGHMTRENAYIKVEELLNQNLINNKLNEREKIELEKQERTLEQVLAHWYLMEHGYKWIIDENNEDDFGHWIKED